MSILPSPEKGQQGAAGPVLSAAVGYRAAGICVVPILLDGSKKAARTWKEYQTRHPTDAELRAWFGGKTPLGIAAVCGGVSGNLEQIDFDGEAAHVFGAWRELVEQERPGLVERLVVIQTPREPVGYRVVYRSETPVDGSTKLAFVPVPHPDTGVVGPVTIVETKGEGGYGIFPGSPDCVHATGRPYTTVQGELCAPPVLLAEERDTLLRCARSFDRWEAYRSCRVRSGGTDVAKGDSLRPGDDYDRRGPDWADILRPHGWQPSHQSGDVVYWRRPDKGDPGHSATTGYCTGKDGEPLLHVFSSNAHPFEGGKAYGKFRAYALLSHAGEFKEAARELGRLGFGEQQRAKPRSGDDGQPSEGTGGAEGGSGPPHGQGGPKRFTVGRLELRPGRPRVTASGKVNVPVSVWDGREQVAHFQITSTISSHKCPARVLKDLLGDGQDHAVETSRAFGRLLAWAATEAERPAGSEDGPTLAEVLAEKVPPAFGFTHRTEQGELWSEARGGMVGRPEFVTYCPSWLIDASGGARDAPRGADGEAVRLELVAALRGEMAVLWSDLQEKLPEVSAATLVAGSEAGRRFREAMTTLWTKPETFEVTKTQGAGDTASRASLVSRARRQETEPSRGNQGWRRISPAFDAWWRHFYAAGTGELKVALAMRWTLAGQMRVPLPGVHDEVSLTNLGRQFGVIDANPEQREIPDRMTGGGRLAVLVADLTDELLSQPADDPEEPTPCPPP